MNCDKHKTYKGIRYPTNGCQNCLNLYKDIHSKSTKYGRYVSISTPDFKCNIIHLISELSSIMLYGPQQRFFWKTNCEAAKHFQKTLKMLKSWQFRNNNLFSNTEQILWHSFVKHWKGFFRTQTIDIDEIEKKETPCADPAVMFNENEANKINKNIFSMFGDNNGEKEERSRS